MRNLTLAVCRKRHSKWRPLSLFLICRQYTGVVTAGAAWATSRTNENMRRRQFEPSQGFTAGIPAKLNSSQLRRRAGGKGWEEQRCRRFCSHIRTVFPASTGGHVAGASAAYENQALESGFSWETANRWISNIIFSLVPPCCFSSSQSVLSLLSPKTH